MTDSAFHNAEQVFGEALSRLHEESRIDNPTYFYFRIPLSNRPNLSLVSETIPKSPHCQVLLDLGCGMGALEIKLHSEKMNVETVGLDLNRQYVRLALLRQKLHGFDNASFVVADIYHIPFREHAIDVVALHDTAPAINVLKVIREDVRVLRKIGTFVLDAPMKGFYDIVPVSRPDFIKYSKGAIVKALKTEGLIVDQILLSGVPLIFHESFHLPHQIIRILSEAVMALPKPLQKILSGFWFSAIFCATMQ